jgi:ligand-binding sensor domain-containing protein
MDVMLTVEEHTPEFTLYDMDNSDLPANAVYCIDFDHDGNIWFGGQKDAGSGIANVSMLSADYGSWTVYADADLSLDGLEDRVYYIAVDDQNTKWFCTHYGVSYLMADGTKGKVDFAVDDYTRTVQVDSEGNIYLSNRTDEGIWFTDDHGANWTLWTAADIGLSSGRPEIYDLRETSDGALYLLTWYGVVYRDAAGNWNEVSDIAGYYTYAMTMDLAGNMWVPDADTQELYKITGGAVTTYSESDAAVLANPINDLEVDDLGNLWLATDGAGLVRMNTSDFSYSVYDSAATAGAIPQDNITHLEILDDVIWMSTAEEGIVRADYLIME